MAYKKSSFWNTKTGGPGAWNLHQKHAKFEIVEKPDGTKGPKCPKPLFVGAKAFMNASMIRNAFLIYILPSPNVKQCPHEIPS